MGRRMGRGRRMLCSSASQLTRFSQSDAALMEAFTQHIKMYNKTYEKQELATRYHTFCANAGVMSQTQPKRGPHLHPFAQPVRGPELRGVLRSSKRTPTNTGCGVPASPCPTSAFIRRTDQRWLDIASASTPVKDQGGCGAVLGLLGDGRPRGRKRTLWKSLARGTVRAGAS